MVGQVKMGRPRVQVDAAARRRAILDHVTADLFAPLLGEAVSLTRIENDPQGVEAGRRAGSVPPTPDPLRHLEGDPGGDQEHHDPRKCQCENRRHLTIVAAARTTHQHPARTRSVGRASKGR